MAKFGIMQGRLVPPEPGRFQSFPREQWALEFPHAAQVPLDYIEWICDLYGADVNPLATEQGRSRLQQMTGSTGVAIRSICADYFMDKPFVRCTELETAERLEELRRIVLHGRVLGVNRVVLPFVDASAIKSEEDFRATVAVLKAALPIAEQSGVELHLETSLAPGEFARLLDEVPHPMLKVNYDSGNSSSLEYAPADEFAAYGDRIGSVHIKDRVLGGGTVPLGTGSADFRTLFDCLKKINYAGDFTLQVARGVPGDEVSLAKKNLEFVRAYWPA